MRYVIDNALDRTAARMENEFDSITKFRWNYYACMLIAMLFFSGLAIHVCGSTDETTREIRSTTSPAVKCLQQLNNLVSKFHD